MKFKLTYQDTTYVGTKQECMHYIKCRKFPRAEVLLEKVKDSAPTEHYTVPVTAEVAKKKSFFKRMFN